jgi:predicted regulator of Ras-like GTPase activity (Roadblock/LC7/MglB family)
MLHLLTKLFRKSKAATPVRTTPIHSAPAAPLAVPHVEIASLSLLAILQRFPEDLKKGVAQMPHPDAMVSLPVPSIVKQLPSGSVKMSLASIYRQAPAGTFNNARVEEKRMVEVPLNEVFKRVKPELLKRRTDQRQHELAEEGIDVFGDKQNPYAIAPTAPDERRRPVAPSPAVDREADDELNSEPPPHAPLRMPEPMVAAPPPSAVPSFRAGSGVMRLATPSPTGAPVVPQNRPSAFSAASPETGNGVQPGLHMPPADNGKHDRNAAAGPSRSAPHDSDPRTTSSKLSDASPLVVALKDLTAKWPDSLLSELGSVDGLTVTLPAGDVGCGLARGKVAFTWGQLRSWIQPALEGETTHPTDMELALPLRVLAPAFLQASKQQKDRRTLSVDESIPALFSGGPAAKAVPAPVAPPPVPQRAPQTEPLVAPPSASETSVAPAVETPSASEAVAEPTTSDAPVIQSDEEEEIVAPTALEPAAERTEIASSVTPQSTPAESAPAPAPAPTDTAQASAESAPPIAENRIPASLGEVFGEPGRLNWSPGEIVQEVVKLPQVAGAIVALSEGLVVAHRLPEGMKGEVVAAFLPQIFGRLNQYSTEMKLGEIDDILLSSQGAYFQAFRAGQVFFAVLGKHGESLPWHALRLMAEELLQQTKK